MAVPVSSSFLPLTESREGESIANRELAPEAIQGFTPNLQTHSAVERAVDATRLTSRWTLERRGFLSGLSQVPGGSQGQL